MTKLRLDDAGARARLADFIAHASGTTVTALEASPLSGGAIQENWLVTANLDGKRQEMVLRTDAPARVAVSHGRAEEFAILQAAFRAGVKAPEPLWLCRDLAVLGQVFYLMRRVAGVAPGYRVVKDKSLGGDRVKLAERLGRELALIHTIRPGAPGLGFLPASRSPGLDQIEILRADLDRRVCGYPVLEWGLRWAERHAPAAAEIVLIHQDFRSGNYMVDAHGLTAVLDWEFATWGDPMADIGWFCAKCWRYGEDTLEAGGIARREDFYRGYETAAPGRKIDAKSVHFWEVMAHLRWAIIALQQADRHISGQQRSLELALTGRILPELELTIIDLIAPGPWPTPAQAPAYPEQPDGAMLLAEARRVLSEDLLAELPERRRYEARMIANAMAIAGRELAGRAAAKGDEKTLADDIRSGRYDNDASLRDRLAADVLARLSISNPKALPRV